ncbi:MAG: hypothetical protein CMP95_09080 [Gammaproteobacteria bacterium]|uniref:Copper chaperone PCu(A)C n=1 Tax=OM182 bacterium TaxID=2510334 RepID=A0A520S3Q9_9GAMM|nr:hypothetical protein [Gammaproteobacteria bacterium]OUV67627.1 MAG: hypothetical protein CBC93_05000 [Gammaproteobacteria bacterium TMED133]RZO77093.1 MAG: copper chaperone PCu(A)C [OM182 bacterium]
MVVLMFRTVIVFGCIFCANVSANDVYFNQAWLRETPQEHSSVAIYGRLINESQGFEFLESVTSEQANLVMLHRSVKQQGMIGMVHIESVQIAPGETAYFEPAGLHMMAIGLRERPVQGDCLKLILQFRSGKEIKARAIVGSIAQMEFPRKKESCLE